MFKLIFVLQHAICKQIHPIFSTQQHTVLDVATGSSPKYEALERKQILGVKTVKGEHIKFVYVIDAFGDLKLTAVIFLFVFIYRMKQTTTPITSSPKYFHYDNVEDFSFSDPDNDNFTGIVILQSIRCNII